MRTHDYIQALLEQAKLEGKQRPDTALKTPWPHVCRAHECERAFRSLDALQEHAEAVHTFEDIRRMVAEEVRETYGKPGNYQSSPPVPAVWAWVEDLATDWVVFTVETGSDSSLYKASYSILDRVVSLGEPVEVVRRTVYEAVSGTE